MEVVAVPADEQLALADVLLGVGLLGLELLIEEGPEVQIVVDETLHEPLVLGVEALHEAEHLHADAELPHLGVF